MTIPRVSLPPTRPSPRRPLPASRWWLVPRLSTTAPVRLWCFSPAGAGAAIWFPWAARFEEAAEIVALRLPGRETRLAEEPLLRMAEVVRPLVEQLAPHFSPGDIFCGHSLGGLVAFETARALRARGLGSPRALVVCGTPAPHAARNLPPVHALPTPDFIIAVEDRYGPIPREIREHPEFLELLLPALRGDLTIYETYEAASGMPLDSAVLALGGEGDMIVASEDVREWRVHTSGPFEVDFISGGHFFPQENVAATVARIRAFLPPGDAPAQATTVRPGVVAVPSNRLQGR
jgi:medium-chain acyl-[acyl-carrier-protein] hydrolase